MNLEAIENELKNMHSGQYDKAGFEYYKHPIWVKENLPKWAPDYLKAAALLHDVMEDTKISISELTEKFNLPFKCVYLLNSITKTKNTTYNEYIEDICNSKDIELIALKLTDMKHNIDPVRLSMLDSKTCERLVKKYMKNYFKLRSSFLELQSLILDNFNAVETLLCSSIVSKYEKLESSDENDIISRFLYIDYNIFDIFDLCSECPFFVSRYQYPDDAGDICGHSDCDISILDVILFNGEDPDEPNIIHTSRKITL